jgi:hypothetical protein
LFVFPLLANYSASSETTVLTNTYGEWTENCGFEYQYSYYNYGPECWFLSCPGQVYNFDVAPDGCSGDGYISFEQGGADGNGDVYGFLDRYNCTHIQSHGLTLGPTEACTYVQLRYECEGEKCLFNTTITSRPVDVSVAWQDSSNANSLNYEISGLDLSLTDLYDIDCYVLRYHPEDALLGTDYCLGEEEFNGGGAAVVAEAFDSNGYCTNGVYSTGDLDFSYGGSYEVKVILSLRYYDRYTVLGGTPPLTISPTGGQAVSLTAAPVAIGYPVTGTWTSSVGAAAGDVLQVVGASQPGERPTDPGYGLGLGLGAGM